MNIAAVISRDGLRLMPMSSWKARKYMANGKAVIYQYRPFTIQLTYQSEENIQPVELSMDTGYLNIGLSVKSESHEYVSHEYKLLSNEVERHNDQRKYRRTRRNRLRYRKSRFDNRIACKQPGWLAPSLRNKAEQHIRLVRQYSEVFPITSVILEMGQFDPQVLKAVMEGRPVPQGLDYQYGDQYGYDTLREALFSRDGYVCQICGKTPWKDGISLHRHHMGYWKGDRTNRMSNLLTVGSCCHTPANHQPKGKLYGLNKKVRSMASAAFMNSIKWQMYNTLKAEGYNISITYGAVTKHTRKLLNIGKTHADDAFCIGNFHPIHRSRPVKYEKRRINNRILTKFYDARYLDLRDNSIKTGKDLSCGRTNRNHNRDTENLHQYRCQKLSKGRVSIRKQHYRIQPGDILSYKNQKYLSVGCQNLGTYVRLKRLKSPVPVKNVTVLKYADKWICTA